MLTPILRAFIIAIIIVVYFIQDAYFLYRYDRLRKGGGSGRGWIYIAFLFIGIALVLLQTIFLPWLGFFTKEVWGLYIEWFGVLLVIGALALHIWARTHLRQFYTEYIEVQPGHYVVETGPYAIVRHPIFLSFFVMIVGIFLFNPLAITLIAAIYTFWDFSRSALKEEKLLSKELPEYIQYMESTPRFIPHVFGRK